MVHLLCIREVSRLVGVGCSKIGVMMGKVLIANEIDSRYYFCTAGGKDNY